MKILNPVVSKSYTVFLCVSLIMVLFLGSINNINKVSSIGFDGALVDDFNDDSYSDWWTYTEQNTDANVTNQNGYISMDIESGSDGVNSLYSSYIVYNNITVGIDKYLTVNTDDYYGYFGLGSNDAWTVNLVYMDWGYYQGGGVLHIGYYNDSGRVTLYNTGYNPNFAQMKIRVFSLNESISFYQNDIKLINFPISWFWDIYNLTICRVTLGLMYDSSAVNGRYVECLFDNFYSYYGEINNNDFITTRFKPIHTEYVFKSNIGFNVWGSIDNILIYPKNWNLSIYIYNKSGFRVDSIIYENTTDIYDIVTESNQSLVFINTTTNTNISVTISLLNDWWIVDLTSIGFGIDIRYSYYPPYTYMYSIPFDFGIKCFPNNTYIVLFETENLIIPHDLTPIFDDWKIYDNDSILINIVTNNNVGLLINNNVTIEVNSHLPYQNNSWWMRSADLMDTTPPIPPMGGYYFHEILNELVDLNNGSDAINYIQLRVSYYYNETENRYKICDKVRYFINITYNPNDENSTSWIQNPNYLWENEWNQGIIGMNLDQLELAVNMIHSHGFKVLLVALLSVAGTSNYPSWFSYSNISSVRWVVENIGENVLIPFAQYFQNWGVEDYGLSVELQEGVYNLGDAIGIYPPFGEYIITQCNDIWNNIIYEIRKIYTGRLTQMITGFYRPIDFEVLKRGYYIKNLDYIILDCWWKIQTNSTVFTSKDMSIGWFNSYGKTNMVELLSNYSKDIGKQIIINQGYPNRFGGLDAPWSGTGSYNWRDDDTMFNAWRGSIWALTGLDWFGGFDFESYTFKYGNVTEGNAMTGTEPPNFFWGSWRLTNETREMIAYEINKMNISSLPPTPLTLNDMIFTEINYYPIVNNTDYSFIYWHYPNNETININLYNKTYNFYTLCYKNNTVFQPRIVTYIDIGNIRSILPSGSYLNPYSWAYSNGLYNLTIDEDGIFYWNNGTYYLSMNILAIPNNQLRLTYIYYDNNTYIGNRTHIYIISLSESLEPDDIYPPLWGYSSVLDLLFNNLGIGLIILVPSFALMTMIHNPIGLFVMMNIITYINWQNGLWEITYFLFTILLSIIFIIIVLMGGFA